MNSRTKGKVGEREFAALLRAYGFDARRGQQFSGSPDSPDVVSEALAWLHVEVKRVQNLNLTDACAQASGDSGGKPWIVAHRRNHAPWFITMSAETFFNFLRGELPLHGYAPVAQTPNHEGQQQNNNQERTNIMKIANPNSRFEPCPEFTGRAVIVDVTPMGVVECWPVCGGQGQT